MAGAEDTVRDDETNAGDADDVLTVDGKAIDLNTLTDISRFLSEQNNQLDSQLSGTKQA